MKFEGMRGWGKESGVARKVKGVGGKAKKRQGRNNREREGKKWRG